MSLGPPQKIFKKVEPYINAGDWAGLRDFLVELVTSRKELRKAIKASFTTPPYGFYREIELALPSFFGSVPSLPVELECNLSVYEGEHGPHLVVMPTGEPSLDLPCPFNLRWQEEGCSGAVGQLLDEVWPYLTLAYVGNSLAKYSSHVASAYLSVDTGATIDFRLTGNGGTFVISPRDIGLEDEGEALELLLSTDWSNPDRDCVARWNTLPESTIIKFSSSPDPIILERLLGALSHRVTISAELSEHLFRVGFLLSPVQLARMPVQFIEYYLDSLDFLLWGEFLRKGMKGECPGQRLFEGMVERYSDQEYANQKTIAEFFGKYADAVPSLYSRLIDVARARGENARAALAASLPYVSESRRDALLEVLLSDSGDFVLQRCLAAISHDKVKSPQAERLVRSLFSHPSEEVRAEAVAAMVAVAQDPVDVLANAIDDPSDRIQCKAFSLVSAYLDRSPALRARLEAAAASDDRLRQKRAKKALASPLKAKV